jgi:beta-glucanase (GH16 family)
MSRHPSRGRRASVAAAFACFVSVLLPSAHADAALSPHFALKLHDSFTTGVNTARWGVYDGRPGGTTYSVWDSSHVQAYQGSALLRGYREGSTFVTGGMMLTTLPQTYGKYAVRAKFDKSASVEQAMLLWPVAGWPPEVDFAEGPTTYGNMATSHWSAANSQQHAFRKVDMTQWHTYGVEWTPTSLLFTMDGVGYGRMTGSAVPHQPMNLAIQTIATRPVGAVSTANPSEVRMSVADVWVWSYS